MVAAKEVAHKDIPDELKEIPQVTPTSSDANQRSVAEAREERSHPNRCNPNKFCLYHYDYGYDIEECIQLQDEIEELIPHGSWIDLFATARRGMRAVEGALTAQAISTRRTFREPTLNGNNKHNS